MHSPLARCARAHEAGSPTAPKPFFQVRPLGGDGLSLFELAFPDGQVAALYVSNYCGKPTYLGVLETVLREPPPSLRVVYLERTQRGKEKNDTDTNEPSWVVGSLWHETNSCACVVCTVRSVSLLAN